MIQTHHFQAPQEWQDAAPVVAAALQYAQTLSKQHPALRGTRIETDAGMVNIWLRVAASDRWRISNMARQIAASLLRNMKLPIESATLVGMETALSARSFTLEQGRNPNHTPRTNIRRRKLKSQQNPEGATGQ